ncbi:MAG: Glycosyl hydrolases family 2, sugar binding domain [Lentisphaerae bacterium ADurb.BinA184]|nr:MAG: Glycosyl hydrolases family 2, sugar binding domain [Lentisphaerae bacterium ADurb.BinA184]
MKLAALFSDHAVLQQGLSVPVWGWTKPNMHVRVRLGEWAAESMSAMDGRFLVRLPPLKAGGPYDLKVDAVGKRTREQAVVRDVWVGEVWVASGQSNMEFTVAACGEAGEKEIRKGNLPGLRMITIPRLALAGRQSDVEAAWRPATPETLGEFSAVGHYFARRLHEELGVPVGIINTSWGGTIVEAWTSREALVQNPDTCAEVHRYEATTHAPHYWRDASGDARPDPRTRALPPDPGNRGFGRGWAKPDFADQSWPTMALPQTWQSAGHNYSGVFWFRLAVEVPAAWAGRDLALRIGAVDKQDTTYFNGVKVGGLGEDLQEQFWNVPRDYRVPGRQVKAGRNVIAVRAFSFIYGGGMIGPADKMSLGPADGKGRPLPLAGDWRYQEEHNLGLTVIPSIVGPGNPNSPYMLFDNMIAPLLPYAIRGAIWYQGESNAGNAAKYCGMQTAMIRDWRRAWGQGDFPFLFVQLANFTQPQPYQPASTWAALREAQTQTLAEPATGMAVIVDIGDAADIHPKNKWDVGGRLAQWALTRTYGRPGVPSGPLYAGLTVEGDRIRLHFNHVGRGLVAKRGALKTFVIADASRAFRPATAVIDGATVVVSHPDVAAPVAVRYAWADNPEGCNLYNADGLPASPFRTDTW